MSNLSTEKRLKLKIVTATRWPSFMNVAVLMKRVLSKYCSCTICDQVNVKKGGNILFIGTVSQDSLILLGKFLEDSNIVFYGTIEGHSFLTEDSRRIANHLKIVAVSNFVKQMLEEVGLSVAGTVHHGVDMHERKVDLQFYEMLKRKFENKTILFTVSANHSRKGLETLLQGYQHIEAKMKNTVLILHSEPTGYFPLSEIAERLKLERFWLTDLFGKLSLSKLNAFYKLCHIYVQPSYCEGFGLPIIEAFRFDKPVIAVNAPPFNEIVKQRETGILMPVRQITWFNYENKVLFKIHRYNVEDLANAIVEIMTNPHFLTEMQENIRKEKNRWNIYNLYPNILKYFS